MVRRVAFEDVNGVRKPTQQSKKKGKKIIVIGSGHGNALPGAADGAAIEAIA